MIIQRSQESLTIRKILVEYRYTYLKSTRKLPFRANFTFSSEIKNSIFAIRFFKES
jgi:hypothetical protein